MKLTEGFVYGIFKEYSRGEITFSRFVEMINEENQKINNKSMDIFKEGDFVEIILQPNDVETAIRQFISYTNPEYSKDWILNPKYNLGTVLFTGTKE